MDINKRVKDVSQIFDERWKINHNYQEMKSFHDDRKKHFDKMYNIQDRTDRKREILEANSVNGRVQRLEEKMSAVRSNDNLGRMNSFKNNFR